MATINSYLSDLSSKYFISYGSTERQSIDKSVDTIKTRLSSYLPTEISGIYNFGSYSRGTILPREYDSYSDIDMMIVLNHSILNKTPETYRTWIKNFADKYYSSSEIYKSFPTVTLNLNHIQFDLVPTIYQNGSYQIPDKNNTWMSTDPNGFNKVLTDANTKYDYLVKPIVRLLKAWNAKAGYPYQSFQLEQHIAAMSFAGDNYERGFFYAIRQLPTWYLTETNSNKVTVLRNNVVWVKKYLEEDNIAKAKEWLHKILPY